MCSAGAITATKFAGILWAMIKHRRPYTPERLGNRELRRHRKQTALRGVPPKNLDIYSNLSMQSVFSKNRSDVAIHLESMGSDLHADRILRIGGSSECGNG